MYKKTFKYFSKICQENVIVLGKKIPKNHGLTCKTSGKSEVTNNYVHFLYITNLCSLKLNNGHFVVLIKVYLP